MNILFWLIICAVIGYAIWWVMDWHDKFPDGEWIVVIPSKRRHFGRRFDSAQLHHKSILCFYDGADQVSTGWDSRDGNTVGDDRKSSKSSKCKSIYIQVYASSCISSSSCYWRRICTCSLRNCACEVGKTLSSNQPKRLLRQPFFLYTPYMRLKLNG